MRFIDRTEAGRQLATRLEHLRRAHPLVLALPRGGVPVACEVAAALGADLDVCCVRKIGAPGFHELGIGAVAEGGAVYLDPRMIAELGVSPAKIDALVQLKQKEVAQLAAHLRAHAPAPDVHGRVVIIVDDGLATGATARAAIASMRAAGAEAIVLAVPVAASQSLEDVRRLADEVVCVQSTPQLEAVSRWYEDFVQFEDAEVIRLLRQHRALRRARARRAA